MIEIVNLHKSYGQIKALDGINLSITEKCIFGLLGLNGAGKTTLVSILNGLTQFDSGKIEVMGMPLPDKILNIRKQTAFIPQQLAFYDKLTVIENLLFFSKMYLLRTAERQNNIDRAIHINNLQEVINQRAFTLSGGQKRRLNIAIGLLNNPKLIYFDEPTVGVDPQARNIILDTILGFKEEGITVIYTSHYLAEIEKICDKIAIVDKGKIIIHGDTQALISSQNNDFIKIRLARPLASDFSDHIKNILEIFIDDDMHHLVIQDGDTTILADLMILLKQHDVKILKIEYGNDALESLFLNLTTMERAQC